MNPSAKASRPQVHFTAQAGWVNDPLGLTWHDGQYHLFFQYLPGRTTWALECRWGHATSPDLLHWTEQPLALAPGDGDDGVWSGSIAVAINGKPRLFYTAVSTAAMSLGTIRTATPVTSDWIKWEKNSTIIEPARDYGLTIARDPFVFQDGDLWRMLVGASLTDGSAAVLSYSSPDLASWSPDGIAAQRHSSTTEPTWTGSLWECPQLLRFPENDVLIVSVWDNDILHNVVYSVGEYSGGRFEGGDWQPLTIGDGLYAASTFHDQEGQQALVFWDRGTTAHDTWAGAISIPYQVSLRAGALRLAPHPVLLQSWNQSEVFAGGDHRVEPQVYFEWTAPVGGRLDLLSSSGDFIARLEKQDDQVLIDRGGHQERLTTDHQPVAVIADGPLLEISTGLQLLASMCDSLSSISVSEGTVIAHQLLR